MNSPLRQAPPHQSTASRQNASPVFFSALLATHVGDEPLDHWHGAPLRLAAPGRRGFMWVKWVREVVVLTQPDLGQWVAIFTSGPDAT